MLNSQPIIGLISVSVGASPFSSASLFLLSASLLYFCTSCTKWKAAIILPLSVRATAGIFSLAVLFTRSLIAVVDCKIEYWVWLCRWAKAAVSSSAISSSEAVISGVLPLLRNASEASLRFTCLSPISPMGEEWCAWKFSIYSLLKVPSLKPSPRRISSKKQRAVASTSAVALWASAKGTPNKKECNSVSEGNLYLPPRPPSILQRLAVASVQVSITGSLSNGLSTP